MSNPFLAVGHGLAKFFHALIGGLQKADAVIDKDLPIIEDLLEKGASVAQTIPGIGPQAAEVLDAGVTLLSQFKLAADGTNAAAQALQTKLIADIGNGTGFSVLVIETDVKVAVDALIAKYEAEYEAAKSAVTTATEAKK